jgi:hypothetical protein
MLTVTYAKCHVLAIMLSVVVINVVILSVVRLSVMAPRVEPCINVATDIGIFLHHLKKFPFLVTKILFPANIFFEQKTPVWLKSK